ncbi:hypothetical protein ACFO0J_15625 [Castellaniella hirudinis]|uniref:Restriction endonuclease n=1 Tax=Castellaniella hirudinis TaxID=1144617 RepID=A0ABV8S1L7_9BURK
MSYYTGNDVYRRLDAAGDPGFVWVSGNAWILIYGDAYAHAKVVAFVRARSIGNENTGALQRTRHGWALAKELAQRVGLPFFDICYEDQAEEIDSVELNGHLLSLEKLKNDFESAGLQVKNGTVGKAINSRESSAYHHWQRQSLGSITVSDIDLFRLDDHRSTPIEIIELKRSYFQIQDWKPYPQDFPNFNLIVDVARRADIQFTIAYNYHVKRPAYIDDASSMSLFEYPSPAGNARHSGIFTFDQFVAGDYLQGKGQR